ncbi:MAG TPA: ABC transporter permease [Gammaproteobacteria bacterium]
MLSRDRVTGVQRWFGPLIRDAALVSRRLLRTPAFAAAAVLTLTIGLGMFGVVYTVVEKILLEPLPYRNPGDLYYVWRDYGATQDRRRAALPGTDVLELQRAGGVIESAVALQAFLGGVFSWRMDEDPIEISTIVTAPGLFETLGVQPALGRVFAPDDAGPDAPFTMVLTDELWNRLGADPGILGKEVRLNGRPHTVIGVLPRDFHFVRNDADGPPQQPDAYSNLRVHLTDPSPNQSDYSALIRVRPGTSPEAVGAAVDAVGRIVDARDFNGRGLKLDAVGVKTDLVARARPALLALAAAGIVLALMLMVNLASVLLARAAQREHEVAVSRALGADGVAVARGALLEGSLLGIVGGALGAFVALWGTQALVALAPLDLPRREAIALDWQSGAAVIGVGFLLGLVAAVAPALFAARSSLSTLLASSGLRGGGGPRRLRRAMIVAQVALSLVLLNSGALVARSLDRLLRTDPGFRAEGVFTVLIRTPPAFFPNSEVVAFQDKVTAALASVPGVTRVGATGVLPLGATSSAPPTRIVLPDAPGNTGDRERDAVLTDVVRARAGYFEVMGMRLVAGRTFVESPGEAREAVIDTTFARRFFPGVNPIGTRIPYDGRTIVGVVDHARLYDLRQDGRPQLYFQNTAESFQRAQYYVLATTRDPETLLPEVRAAVRGVDSRVAVGEARTMVEIVADALRQQRTGTTLISGFALGALLLAAMGIFGVIAASVTRRHHELAVRLAVGAEGGEILRLIVREAALLVGGGLALGVPAVYAAGGLIRGALVGVSPSDPLTLLGVTAGLAVVTLMTASVAARRVLTIDPAELLRKE